MFKNSIFLGLASGLSAGTAAIIFAGVYKEAMYVDFSEVLTSANLIGACVFGTTIASLGYLLIKKVLPKKGDLVFNILFTLLTFASIVGPIAHTFPPEMDDMIQSYFPSFAITLHFFPMLFWLVLKPFFIK